MKDKFDGLIKQPIPIDARFKNLLTEPASKFGKLTVTDYMGSIKNGKNTYHCWMCLCDCGNIRICITGHLTQGCIVRCDKCPRNDDRITHNLSGSSEYKSWSMMKQRCKNNKHPHYEYYGGRGITYCERWEKFENFLEDMKEKPEPKEKYSLDRYPDMNGNYELTNCRWATDAEQVENKRDNLKLEYNGGIYSTKEIADMCGITVACLRYRMSHLSIKDIIEKEVVKFKPVLQLHPETGEILNEYKSVEIASKETETPVSSIRKCVCKKQVRKLGGKFSWRYVNDSN